jgi:hypothetical protein
VDVSISLRQHRLPKNASQEAITEEFLHREGLRQVPADHITWLLGWYSGEDPLGEDRLWRHRTFARYTEEFGARLAELYADRYRCEGREAANAWLTARHVAFSQVRFDLALDEGRLKRTADEAARAGRVMLAQPGADSCKITAVLCARYRVGPPKCKQPAGASARLVCPRWWRRNLRCSHGQHFEEQARSCGLVSSRRGRYVSDATVRRRTEQRANAHELFQLLIATNEIGVELSLADLHRHSESNPSIRRAALLARLAGFESIAKKHGYVGVFYTVTCPSRMHAYVGSSGMPNPRFDGTSPRDAQRYLRAQFQKVRAKWGRRGLKPFGFRVCEPHCDGTPHWHLLLFMSCDSVQEVTAVLRHYALESDPTEPGALYHRFKAVEIDGSKGSATGYIVKYISKHLDGRGLTVDEHGTPINEAIQRVDAWVSTWRNRLFQQVGGPPAGVWRELRRLQGPVDAAMVEEARAAADRGDWAAYVEAQGGPHICARDMPIRVLRVWSDSLGRYGEPQGYLTQGVVAGSVAIPTRLHTWKISVDPGVLEARRALTTGQPAGVRQSAAPGRPGLGGRPDAAQSPLPAGVPVSRPAASFRPWSSVNNYTQQEHEPPQLQLGLLHELKRAVPTAARWEPKFWKSQRAPE